VCRENLVSRSHQDRVIGDSLFVTPLRRPSLGVKKRIHYGQLLIKQLTVL